MKTRWIISWLCAATLFAIGFAVVIFHRHQPVAAIVPGRQTFVVKGMIRALDSDDKTVRIEHEEIPDYMPAMTMPFAVKDTNLLKNLKVGEAIQFQLVITDDDSWISDIEKINESQLNFAAISKTEETAARDLNRIEIGEVVPTFSLTNQNGRAFSLSDFKGKAVLVTFIYTRCPIPNYCPLLSKNFAELQERFAKEFPEQFQLISVSFDPKFDTPAVLNEYSARWSPDEKTWTFATGSAEQIATVAGIFGAFYETKGTTINHDLRTALISPEGKLVHVWKSNVWTPYEVQRMVREILTGSRDAIHPKTTGGTSGGTKTRSLNFSANQGEP